MDGEGIPVVLYPKYLEERARMLSEIDQKMCRAIALPALSDESRSHQVPHTSSSYMTNTRQQPIRNYQLTFDRPQPMGHTASQHTSVPASMRPVLPATVQPSNQNRLNMVKKRRIEAEIADLEDRELELIQRKKMRLNHLLTSLNVKGKEDGD
jgi:hypothetical protein